MVPLSKVHLLLRRDWPTSKIDQRGRICKARFRELLQKNGFFAIPSVVRGDQQGTDGSDWRIEAIIGGRYHTASRWSPTSSQGPGKQAIAELGKALAFDIGNFQVNLDEIY